MVYEPILPKESLLLLVNKLPKVHTFGPKIINYALHWAKESASWAKGLVGDNVKRQLGVFKGKDQIH